MNEETENESPWDSLIGELGVEIKPEALQRKQPAPQELPAKIHEWTEVAPPAAAPSDWAGLASSLGLEVPPEEPAPKKAVPAARKPAEKPVEARPEVRQRETKTREAKQRDERKREDRPREEKRPARSEERPRGRSDSRRREKPVEVQEDIVFEEVLEESSAEFADDFDNPEVTTREPQTAEEQEKQRISGEAARSAFDALFSADAVNWGSAFVSPRTNVESSFLYTEGEEAVFAEDIPETSAASDDESEEEYPKKRPRRRRRGGRGRGRKSERSESEATDEDFTEETTLDDDAKVAGEDAEGATEDGEAPSEKPRRRRRPRGRSRRSEEGDSSPEIDETQVRRRIAAHVGEEDDDDEVFGDDDEGDEAEGGRASHRNLPTWNDAIGVIVEGNLAQRSKAPAKPQGAPRGRARGGRRHKKT